MKEKAKMEVSSNMLRNFAIFTMISDHIGYKLIEHGIFNQYNSSQDILELLANRALRKYVLFDNLLRGIGRMSYPLFAYCIVVSFTKTRSVRKYMIRMFIFALLSEIPFDLFCSGTWLDFGHQNVLFTYLLGLLALCSIKHLWYKDSKYKFLTVQMVCICIAMGHVCHVDYDFVGVLVVVLFYVLQEYEIYRDISVVIVLTFQYIFNIFSGISMLLIHFCNGRYRKARGGRYSFYIFYPAHMLLLTILDHFLF